MDEFVSWLNHEMETNNACGEIFYFSMDQSKVERLGTLSNNLTDGVCYFRMKSRVMQRRMMQVNGYSKMKWYIISVILLDLSIVLLIKTVKKISDGND
jgi:hypothetical protein